MKIHFLDLFSGAGGLTLGFTQAGMVPVGAIEFDRFACETYRQNFPGHNLIEGDIRALTRNRIKANFNGVDLIVGGPPCQGFSVAGPSQYGKLDQRNYLIFELLRFVQILRPKFFLVENVKGLLSGRLTPEKSAFKEYKIAVEKLGYSMSHFVLQAANFGVPQWRERVFIFGALNKQHLPKAMPSLFGLPTKPWRTVQDALGDLPHVDAGGGVENAVSYVSSAKNEYQQWMRKNSGGVYNHVAMKHTPRLIERFKRIPIGGSLVNVPAKYGQRIRNGNELDVRPRFKMNNQRLDPNKIATAITASFQSTFVHPTLNRNLTAREGARLQSFPDWFIFHGPRTLMSNTLLTREGRHDEIGLSQYNQIGNAVPPLMARTVGSTILQTLGNEARRTKRST